MKTPQEAVREWVEHCFGQQIADDKQERSHRFLEESLELVQSAGITKEEALMLVDYVYSRPVGHLPQEVGGVYVTLLAFCAAFKLDAEDCGATELARCWEKSDKIREKQKNKPRNSPLPQ